MAKINLSENPDTAVSGYNKTKEIATTSTAVITPLFSSISRVTGSADAPQNFDINSMDAPGTGTRETIRGFLRGRRPHFGLLFPRGYYNR